MLRVVWPQTNKLYAFVVYMYKVVVYMYKCWFCIPWCPLDFWSFFNWWYWLWVFVFFFSIIFLQLNHFTDLQKENSAFTNLDYSVIALNWFFSFISGLFLSFFIQFLEMEMRLLVRGLFIILFSALTRTNFLLGLEYIV